MTSLNEVSGQTEFLNTMSLILMIISVTFLVAAIVLWFVLKIPHSFKVLTGVGAGKSISKLKEGSKNGTAAYYVNTDVHASLNWNTSARLDNRVLPNEDDEGTVVLNEDTVLLSEDTVVLSNNDGFEINEDIIYTNGNRQ
ncbi:MULTISPECIES: hypothetical protein [Pseudobutyrivibrio]|jgi:hypothetical protein|uniref:Uncharacterized protein n=1 Tax=Pseudobutyrivibrio ruminis TaxID=46206 RepID=A0A2G3DXD7_9FIRM|nr:MULTISPECIES: hypothetical protein [Pseudobutyrivibrio]MBE5904972.1 hypothetical protein [Pseudobutyrivibrio sp.]PHU35686.1 hypothetical protein CSX01_03540 [Pseudobutyrivibrio ruminis]SCX94077.1 hypothetical protein SAMN05660668_00894 [Pseudobutyrivibrio sp. AR14]